jgi:hypothetical protein
MGMASEGSMTSARSRADKTDQAALFGAALAAILTLVLATGPWEPLGLVFGIVLLAVVAAYYRPPPPTGWLDATTKAAAFAAVVGLVGFILLAFPLQELWIRPAQGGSFVGCPAPDRNAVVSQSQDYENCLGSITSSWAWLVWLVLFVLAFAGWWLWMRPAGQGRADYKPFKLTPRLRTAVRAWYATLRRRGVSALARVAPHDPE